jgi:DNA-binding MarR family transcriptional regulator
MVESREELVNEILETFRTTNRVLPVSAPEWYEMDLTMAQLRTLFVLACENQPTIGQVAHCLGISLPTASHLIDRLVQAGLAERSEDPADRRRTLTRLSPAGEDLVGRLRQGRQDRLCAWLMQLDTEDLQALSKGFRALLQVVASSRTCS